MATERVCDRCGARAAEPEGWKVLFLGHRQRSLLTYPYAQVVDEDLGDVCPACVESLRAWRAAGSGPTVPGADGPISVATLQDPDGGRRGD